MIFGGILTILNSVLLFFTIKFINWLREKKPLRPYLLYNTSNRNFDYEGVIDDALGGEIYKYLKYKHKCDETALIEMKMNKQSLLETFITYENKLRLVISECNNKDSNSSNLNNNESNDSLDLGLSLEGLDEETKRKMLQQNFRYTDPNLGIKDPYKVFNTSLISRPSLPNRSTRIFTGKTNISSEQMRRNIISHGSSNNNLTTGTQDNLTNNYDTSEDANFIRSIHNHATTYNQKRSMKEGLVRIPMYGNCDPNNLQEIKEEHYYNSPNKFSNELNFSRQSYIKEFARSAANSKYSENKLMTFLPVAVRSRKGSKDNPNGEILQLKENASVSGFGGYNNSTGGVQVSGGLGGSVNLNILKNGDDRDHSLRSSQIEIINHEYAA